MQAKIKTSEGRQAMEHIRQLIDDIRTTGTDIYGVETASLAVSGYANVLMEDYGDMPDDEIKETSYYNPNAKIDVKELSEGNADVGMMHQVWYNLIANALKYSGRTENPAVEIGSFLRDSSVCYYVKDNGVGFNIAYVDKLFGIFERLQGATFYFSLSR